ncbi:hypothetical protein ACQZ46_02645 [Agrobacterium salinitolerans]
MKALALILLVALSGCAQTPKTDAEAALTLMRSRDPALREIGVLKFAEILDKLPSEKRRDIIAQMIGNPHTREIGMRYFMAEIGAVPPGYAGNCPTDYHVDKNGNRCGARSALSRPGGW